MKTYVHGGDVYRHPGILDFSANLNPLGTPAAVIAAAQESIRNVDRYPDALQEKLKKALSAYEQVPEEWLICGNGAAELIFALVQALRPGKALLAVPSFAEYEQALRGVECQIVYEYLKETEDFRVTEHFLEQLEAEYPDLVFLCNPNNPTGLLIDPDLLRKIVARCQEKKIWLIVDECFVDFVKEEENVTLKPLLEQTDHLFLLKAFTKRYAMAGLRLGYGITASQDLMRAMELRLQPWNVSIPAQEAGVAALKEAEYVEKSRKLVEEERTFLKNEMRKRGYRVWDSEANYLFFYGEDDLYERLLEQGVMIRNCGNYVGLTQGFYRIAVRTREENQGLLHALDQIKQ